MKKQQYVSKYKKVVNDNFFDDDDDSYQLEQANFPDTNIIKSNLTQAEISQIFLYDPEKALDLYILNVMTINRKQYNVKGQNEQIEPNNEILLRLLTEYGTNFPHLDICDVVKKVYENLVIDTNNSSYSIQQNQHQKLYYLSSHQQHNVNQFPTSSREIIDDFDSNQIYINRGEKNQNIFSKGKIQQQQQDLVGEVNTFRLNNKIESPSIKERNESTIRDYSTYYFNSLAQQDPQLEMIRRVRFRQYRELITYFLSYGFGIQHLPPHIIQSFKSPQLTPRLYYVLLIQSLIQGFRSIQDILLFSYRMNVTPKHKTEIRQIMLIMIKYEKWMGLEDLEMFKKVYRYLYEIGCQSEYGKQNKVQNNQITVGNLQIHRSVESQLNLLQMIQPPTEQQLKHCYRTMIGILITNPLPHNIPNSKQFQWTPQMDRVICEGYYRDKKVSNLKPLLVDVMIQPDQGKLLTSDKIKYRYCKIIRIAIKKLLFLIIKLKQVSKVLSDVETLILDDKRIKYIIWGLDAAPARILLLRIYIDTEVNQQLIKQAVKCINIAINGWIVRRRKQRQQQGHQFEQDIGEEFYEKKLKRCRRLKEGEKKKVEQRPYNTSVTTYILQAKRKLVKNISYQAQYCTNTKNEITLMLDENQTRHKNQLQKSSRRNRRKN